MYPQFFLSALAYFLGNYLIRAHELDYHPSWRFLPKDDCGYGAPADRIIGGKEASLGQFPWLARIGYKIKRDRPKLFYLCAGSIINQWYVITAVHCATGVMSDTISSVRVGENYIREVEDCEFNVCAPPVQDILIAQVIKYEDYVGTLAVSYGDIGLLRLTRPIRYHDFTSPICLPSGPIIDNINKYIMPGNSTIEVAGWGLTSSISGHVPNKLMFVRMPVVDLEVCRANFTPNKIDDSQICVGIDYVSPICLPRGQLMDRVRDYLAPNYASIEVAGWGFTDSVTEHIPNKMMYVRMPVVDLEVCKRKFAPNKIDDSQICVGLGDGRDSCIGDSGGPLMNPIAYNSPPKYYLFGIVSYGLKMCGIGAAVYTNVTHYMDWILDRIEM